MSALPRLFVAPEKLSENEPLRLSGAAHHYLCRVLRLGVGDQVLLLDGKSRLATTRIAHLDAEELELERLSISEGPAAQQSEPKVALYMGLLKGERHDLVIQKATELGVAKLVTVLCRRSVPELDGARGEKRQQRWLRIARAAAQQCRRPDLPEVSAPLPLDAALKAAAAATGPRLLLYEGPAPPLRTVLAVPQEPASPEIALLIGPEGGFETAEVAAATAAGFVPCSLGPRVLRAETAAISALAAVFTLCLSPP